MAACRRSPESFSPIHAPTRLPTAYSCNNALISLSASVGSYTFQPTAASTALSVALGRITAFTLASSGL